jgi:hypothetical protein
MAKYLGDYPSQQTVYLMTNAHKADGTPIDGAGGLAVSVYKDDVATEYASDITLVGPFDSRTGLISLKILTTNAFYVAGHDYFIVVTTGTVDSISAVSYVLASFSIENRSALRPTEKGRTLDVASSGEAGIDLTNKLDTVGILPAAQAGAASGLAIVGSTMALAAVPPTKEQVRAEMDSNSTRLENIHADIANIATLGGAIAKTYTVYESDGVTKMASCLVWATSDLAGANEIANRGLTDDLGHHIFYFDVPAGTTVYIWRRKSLKTFANPDIEVV